MKDRLEHRLNELISRLSTVVDRAFARQRVNPTVSNFEQSSRSGADQQGLPTLQAVHDGQAVTAYPVSEVQPHDWAIHEVWRRLPGVKNEDKLAADGEAYRPAHECIDHPTLPCPGCLKWTGDARASVQGNPQCFEGINVTKLG
jgi:hypothetical protein